MVVKGEKIIFPGGGTHFHYGADKYIASLANVRFLAFYGISFDFYDLNSLRLQTIAVITIS